MKKLLAIPAIALALLACSSEERPSRITVDVDAARIVDIDTARLIALETSDSSMLYDINALLATDRLFIVHSRDYVRGFDRRDGHFTGNIAVRGNGEHDFSYVGNIWLYNDTIKIFDPNTDAILTFSPDGKFYGRKKPFSHPHRPGEKPMRYLELPGYGVFSLNFSTDGTSDINPKATFYSQEQPAGAAVAGRMVKEPTTLADGVFADYANRRLLSWEPLRDTIYEITSEFVRPLFSVDFGSRSLSSEVQNIRYLADRAIVFNSRPDYPYASLIRYVQLSGDKLYFSFTCGDETNYLACYDQNSGNTYVCRLATPDNSYSQTTCFKIIGDSVYVEVRNRRDMFCNPLLYPVALNDLQ